MIIAHVGYPKTGTKSLQNNVFPNISGVNYISYNNCKKIFHPLVFSGQLHYYKHEKEVLKNLKDNILDETRDTFLSLENLVGPMFYFSGLNNDIIPQRLKSIGVNKIIISVREQTSFINSLYRQYIQQGGVLKFKDFLKSKELQVPIFNPDFCDYYPILKQFQNVFGNENVFIFTNEEMRNNKQATFKKLEKFIGHQVDDSISNRNRNLSLTNAGINLLRFSNHFTYNSFKPNNLISNRLTYWKVRTFQRKVTEPMFRLFSGKQNYFDKYPELKKQYKDYYKSNNIKLRDEFGIDYINDE